MYRAVIILAFVGIACEGTVLPLPYLETKDNQQELINEKTPIGGTVYVPLQNNNLPPSQHVYPTYPEHSNEYALKSGNEDHLISTIAAGQKISQSSSVSIASNLLNFAVNLVLFGTRTGSFLMRILAIIVLGATFTNLICAYTSMCNVNFLGLNKNEVKEIARTYVTPDSLNVAALMISHAIDKYAAMQYEKDKDAKQDATE